MHEECLSSPFMMAWLILSGALLLVLLQIGLFAYVRFSKSKSGHVITLMQKWLFMIMSALYPLIAKRCFSLLHCPDCNTKEQCDAGSAILLRGQTIAHNILDEVTGNFTRVELKIPCWKDEHMPLGALAVLLLCVFVIGYPAITYWQMRSSTAFFRDRDAQRRGLFVLRP